MKNILIAVFTAMLLSACGSETKPAEDPNPKNEEQPSTGTPADNFTPESKSIQTLNLIDIEGNPIPNADISITEAATEASIASQSITPKDLSAPTTLTTDSEGQLNVNDLDAGTYIITLTLGSTEVSFTIVINDSNTQEETTIAAPVVITENDLGETIAIDASEQGIFFSISGVIYDTNGPVDHAQIEISGGQATNGAIATTATDSEGVFVLIINVGLANLDALETASLRIFKEGYQAIIQTDINAVEVSSITGLSIEITPFEASGQIVYEEGFDQLSTDATCGNWISYTEEASLDVLWHEHETGLNIQNQALVQDLVLLAPNDTSNGYIPDPVNGNACWYGEEESGGVSQGNFLGDINNEDDIEEPSGDSLAENEDALFDGGTSDIENSAYIESPYIDLSNETPPLSLNFRTWWEIESVNPNNNGYDLMTIEYLIESDEEEGWQVLARLNPLSDPATSCEVNRDPIPYSNAGYNKAPLWLWQEPISLNALAGNIIKLRFSFATVDHLFNGFRGWLVDDLSIQKTQGTFPLYIGSLEDGNEDEGSCIPTDEPEENEEF